jgi:hypothetical protein
MTQSNATCGWIGVKRSDGVLIVETFMATHVIIPADEHAAIDRCPACEAELRSLTAAKLVADYCIPLRGPTEIVNS